MSLNELINNLHFGESLFPEKGEDHLIPVDKSSNNYAFMVGVNTAVSVHLHKHSKTSIKVSEIFTESSLLSYSELTDEVLAHVLKNICRARSATVIFKEDEYKLSSKNSVVIVRPEIYKDLIPCQDLVYIKKELLKAYWGKLSSILHVISKSHKFPFPSTELVNFLSYPERQSCLLRSFNNKLEFSYPVKYMNIESLKNDLLKIDDFVENCNNLSDLVKCIIDLNLIQEHT